MRERWNIGESREVVTQETIGSAADPIVGEEQEARLDQGPQLGFEPRRLTRETLGVRIDVKMKHNR